MKGCSMAGFGMKGCSMVGFSIYRASLHGGRCNGVVHSSESGAQYPIVNGVPVIRDMKPATELCVLSYSHGSAGISTISL